MADDPLPPAPVDAQREIALLRGAQAPVVFFELAVNPGVRQGVANMALAGGLHIIVDNKAVDDLMIAGHLRFPISAIASIRSALDHIERAHAEQTTPIPNELKN